MFHDYHIRTVLGELGCIYFSIRRKPELCNHSFCHQNKSLYLRHGIGCPQSFVFCELPQHPFYHASSHKQCHFHSQISNTISLTHALPLCFTCLLHFLFHGHWQIPLIFQNLELTSPPPWTHFWHIPGCIAHFLFCLALQPSRFLFYLQHFIAFICYCVLLFSY